MKKFEKGKSNCTITESQEEQVEMYDELKLLRGNSKSTCSRQFEFHKDNTFSREGRSSRAPTIPGSNPTNSTGQMSEGQFKMYATHHFIRTTINDNTHPEKKVRHSPTSVVFPSTTTSSTQKGTGSYFSKPSNKKHRTVKSKKKRTDLFEPIYLCRCHRLKSVVNNRTTPCWFFLYF